MTVTPCSLASWLCRLALVVQAQCAREHRRSLRVAARHAGGGSLHSDRNALSGSHRCSDNTHTISTACVRSTLALRMRLTRLHACACRCAGETVWLRSMQDQYGSQAKAAGVCLLNMCGFGHTHSQTLERVTRLTWCSIEAHTLKLCSSVGLVWLPVIFFSSRICVICFLRCFSRCLTLLQTASPPSSVAFSCTTHSLHRLRRPPWSTWKAAFDSMDKQHPEAVWRAY